MLSQVQRSFLLLSRMGNYLPFPFRILLFAGQSVQKVNRLLFRLLTEMCMPHARLEILMTQDLLQVLYASTSLKSLVPTPNWL